MDKIIHQWTKPKKGKNRKKGKKEKKGKIGQNGHAQFESKRNKTEKSQLNKYSK